MKRLSRIKLYVLSLMSVVSMISIFTIPVYAASDSFGIDILAIFVIVAFVAVYLVGQIGEKRKEDSAKSDIEAEPTVIKPRSEKDQSVKDEPSLGGAAEEIKTESASDEKPSDVDEGILASKPAEKTAFESEETPEEEKVQEAAAETDEVEAGETAEPEEVTAEEAESETSEVEKVETEETKAEVVETETDEAEAGETAEPEEVTAEEAESETAEVEKVETEETEAEVVETETDDKDKAVPFAFATAEDGIPRYRWSFLARLIQTTDQAKYYYLILRKTLLAYKKVRSNVSWNYDSYFLGRTQVAKLKIRGKKLYIYLPLEYSEMENTKYNGSDVSSVQAYKKVPFSYAVTGSRKLKYALELINRVLEGVDFKEPEYIELSQVNEAIPFESVEELLERNLVKISGYSSYGSVPVADTDDDDDQSVLNETEEEQEDEEEVVVKSSGNPVEKEQFDFSSSDTNSAKKKSSI